MVLVDEDEREKAVAAGGRTVCLNVPQEGIAKAVAQIESKMVTIAKFLCRVSWTKRLRSLTSGGCPGSHSGHSSPMVTVAFFGGEKNFFFFVAPPGGGAVLSMAGRQV